MRANACLPAVCAASNDLLGILHTAYPPKLARGWEWESGG